MFKKIMLAGVLLYCNSFSNFSFLPNSSFIDSYGNRLSNLMFENGMLVANDYRYDLQTPPDRPDSQIYSSVYSSSDYVLSSEPISNYNRIGEYIGTHWRYFEFVKDVRYKDVPGGTTMNVVNISNGYPMKVSTEYKTVYYNTPTPITVVASIKPSIRQSVRDVNTFDPVSSTDGHICLGTLKDYPSMRYIYNIHQLGNVLTNDNCLATAYVIMGDGDSDPFNKPLVFSDGFDPRSRIGIQELLEDVPNSLATSAHEFMKTVLQQGFDVVFVDFADGGGDIITNARYMLRVIEEVSEKSSNVAVGGFSMGGLVARVALLLGEKNNVPCMSKVKKFVSIDSPQLGAQVNLSLQKKIVELSSGTLINLVDYLSFDYIAASAFDLSSKAARQMLIKHATKSEYEKFFSFLKDIGNFPKRIKKYGIAYSSWIWPYPNASLSGTRAAQLNGSDLYVADDDLFPGSYLDLFAANVDLINNLPDGASDVVKNFLGLVTYPPENPVFGETRYLPTHIPLYSALGIEKSNFLQLTPPKNDSELDALTKTNSYFDKLFIVDYNTRPRHIVFDNNMAQKVLLCLKRSDISAIIQMLISD